MAFFLTCFNKKQTLTKGLELIIRNIEEIISAEGIRDLEREKERRDLNIQGKKY